MPSEKTNRIPTPPNDGRRYKYVGGKHVAIDKQAQKPAEPASARRARAEAEAKAEAEKAETQAETKSGKRG